MARSRKDCVFLSKVLFEDNTGSWNFEDDPNHPQNKPIDPNKTQPQGPKGIPGNLQKTQPAQPKTLWTPAKVQTPAEPYTPTAQENQQHLLTTASVNMRQIQKMIDYAVQTAETAFGKKNGEDQALVNQYRAHLGVASSMKSLYKELEKVGTPSQTVQASTISQSLDEMIPALKSLIGGFKNTQQ